MKRVQLFEFMDLKYFPSFLRNLNTDVLELINSKGQTFDAMIPIIDDVSKKSKTNQIVDLCSGGGGAWIRLSKLLKEKNTNVRIKLTDKFPNSKAIKRINSMQSVIKYEENSVDALNVPKNLQGVRTIFGGFHHMKEDVAKAILKKAKDDKQGIVISEAMLMPPKLAWITLPIQILLLPLMLIYYWIMYAKVMKGSPLTVVARLLFTYLIPIAPLTMIFDSFISIVRIYDKQMLEEMVQPLQGDDYTYKVDIVRTNDKLPPVVYVIGYQC
ncbi:hypothetical protein [Cellulosilyticum ruminicola]|uniref:hypothetical protein n=1 Tax=Cellulosilyticum ruminicola TaxID=425254 RepID=UPI0006D2071B|nr:hypothetical protein [Cellulosilyticum ruminicola]